jgi:hypothetical protein
MDNQLVPIDPAEIARLKHIDREEIHARLKLFIADLLVHDFERLCSLMYRHDVNEALFGKALSLPTDEERADVIAHLVIDRELKKTQTRAAYAKSKKDDRIDQ